MSFESGNIPQETLDFLEAKRKTDSASGRGWLVFLVLLSGLTWIAIHSIGGSVKQAKTKQIVLPPAPPAYDARVLVERAKGHFSIGAYGSTLEDIGELHEVDISPAVKNLSERATRALHFATLKQARIDRVDYANSYERALLEAGQDYAVRTQGTNADTLRISFVLINRPYVYQIENDESLNARWVQLGFKTVILTDGFDASWSLKPK